MARSTKTTGTKPARKTPRKAPKKQAARLSLDRDQDTTSVLHGPMRDAIRQAFLKRSKHP